jgi:hypothetical protein
MTRALLQKSRASFAAPDDIASSQTGSLTGNKFTNYGNSTTVTERSHGSSGSVKGPCGGFLRPQLYTPTCSLQSRKPPPAKRTAKAEEQSHPFGLSFRFADSSTAMGDLLTAAENGEIRATAFNPPKIALYSTETRRPLTRGLQESFAIRGSAERSWCVSPQNLHIGKVKRNEKEPISHRSRPAVSFGRIG